jgi:hypothetical protein
MSDTPDFHNVPPWDYQPEGVFSWELREGPRVISSGCSGNLDQIAEYMARYLLPPRYDTLFRLWDMKDQLLLGWCNQHPAIRTHTQDVHGVRAAFRALEPHVDQLLLWEMERSANPKAYIDV